MARLKNLTDRGQETQRHLTDVLMQLILEKGFEQVSVKDITERAGIDRSTFYLHFSDKHDLLIKSQRQLIDDLMSRIAPDNVPLRGIALTFEHMAEHVNQYRVLLQLEGSEIPSQLLHDYIVRITKPIIELRLREGGIESMEAVDIDLIANFITGALRSTARWWLQSGMPYTPAEMTNHFARLVANGLSSLRYK
jgi:AcrR family transcriptional regulator